MKKRKFRTAVFLDRDGTINQDKGYIKEPKELVLFSRAAEAIRLLNKMKVPVIVVTNQSGIARGLFTLRDMHRVNRALRAQLHKKGARLDAIFYCPHHPDFGGKKYRKDCNCRKPRPGMLLKAARRFHVDLKRSYVAGDKIADVLLGQGVGAKSIFLFSGFGRWEWKTRRNKLKRPPDTKAKTLWQAVQWVIKDIRKQSKV